MLYKKSKLSAQHALLFSKHRAYFVLLFTFFLEIFFLLSGVFCIWMAWKSPTLLNSKASIYLKIGISALFVLGSFCAFFLLSLFPFLRTRWFSQNAKQKASISFFFKVIPLRQMFKISYLFFYVRVMVVIHLVLFLSPVLLAGFLFYRKLKTVGFSKLSFVLYLGFLLVFFLLSLYFCLAILQKYSLLSVLVCENPKRPILELLTLSRESVNASAFQILHQKLSFFPWFLLSLFLFPAPYTYSYYFETQAVLSRRILKEHKLLVPPPKPIVFLRLQHA